MYMKLDIIFVKLGQMHFTLEIVLRMFLMKIFEKKTHNKKSSELEAVVFVILKINAYLHEKQDFGFC